MNLLLRLLVRLDMRGPWTSPPALLRCAGCGRETESWSTLLRCSTINHPWVA